jgi:hypothetical protein
MISGIYFDLDGGACVPADRRDALPVRLTPLASARNYLKPFYFIGRRWAKAARCGAVELAWRIFSCTIRRIKSKSFVRPGAGDRQHEHLGLTKS